MTKHLSIIFASLAVIFLSACGQGDVLRVDEVVVNLSPVDGNPSSGYMTIHGGPDDVSLVSVIADDVMRMEMHETVEKDGMAQMQTLTEVAVPAGEKVKFEPGGKHLMIWGVGSGSIQRGTLRMIFIFSNDDRIQVDGVIRQVGGAAAETADEDDTTDEDSAS
ncbi:copper chaperone PCu(A)C [Parasphingorhabdus cellanae]|uniref:Copper chaperone PCu(A)C n=1 Tax=Parasphingorhabdus cellanae TaxID=2806553 RepID=A0ABX7T3N8_9SPHN|nr:copper chaperone PCu(A)C [Parasphingorhabdus cellanae]QTD55417.1 copper chaperone PCu(A)C [Parasphingorhabdus cellanae]